MDYANKKYPKSKNNFQCLGPCYNKSTVVIHPTLLEMVTDNEKNFCPVNEWSYIDPYSGREYKKSVDTCYNPTADGATKEDLELNILMPYVDFNAEHFLKIYYNVFSFEDALEWCVKNNYTSIDTQIRLMKNALKVYGNQIDMIDNRFVEIFMTYLKKKHIGELYSGINQYIGFGDDDKKLTIIGSNKNNLKVDEYYVERTNFIIKMFINYDYVYKFIMRYIKSKKTEWNNIDNHVIDMVNEFVEYVINKINV